MKPTQTLTAQEFRKELENRFKVLCFISEGIGYKAFVRLAPVNIYFHVGMDTDGTIWQNGAISASKAMKSFEEFDSEGIRRLSSEEIRGKIRQKYGSIISKSAIIEADPEE